MSVPSSRWLLLVLTLQVDTDKSLSVLPTCIAACMRCDQHHVLVMSMCF